MANPLSRREMLWQTGGGLGGIALAWLLGAEGALADTGSRGALKGGLHHPAKAKRVVQLFMSGAASQCDTFDYKPLLIERHGQKFDPGGKVELFQSTPGAVMKSPWEWRRRGRSGIWVSDLLPHLAGCVDDMAFLYAMVAKSNVHGPATFMQATGFVLPGFPSMGAWISYGLGRMTDNLPAFVVLPDPRGFPPNGPQNWGAAFLPAEHQATMVRPSAKTPIADLFPPTGSFVNRQSDADMQAALAKLNRRHEAERPGDSRLDARIRSYQMAARMQLSAPEVLDLSKEPKHILRMYGLDSLDIALQDGISEKAEVQYFGRNCLVARRLLERGVRFVQVWSGADNGFPRRNWDSHEDIEHDHGPLGRGLAVGASALLKDRSEEHTSELQSHVNLV